MYINDKNKHTCILMIKITYMYINDKMKNKKYHTVGTIQKYHTVATIQKYHTVGTIQKSNMILMIKTEA